MGQTKFNDDVKEVEHIDAMVDDLGLDKQEYEEGYSKFKEFLPRIVEIVKTKLTPNELHLFNNILNSVEACSKDELFNIFNAFGGALETIEEQELERMEALMMVEDQND